MLSIADLLRYKPHKNGKYRIINLETVELQNSFRTMDKLGLGCPFSFLVGRPQSMSGGPGFLDLNYDCYHQIFSYINVLEDQLNLGRAHPLFQVVLTDILRTRHKKINVRLLKTIPDWEFLLQLCGYIFQGRISAVN